MIQIVCRDEKIRYTAYHLLKAFYPRKEVRETVSETSAINGDSGQDFSPPARIRIWSDAGEALFLQAADGADLYVKLSRREGRNLPWGMLTGVRPVKLPAAWLKEHAGEYGLSPEAQRTEKEHLQKARAAFIYDFGKERFVSPEKAGLAFDIACLEQDILREQGLTGDGASLYVGIPFCPSVCRYCSFSSGPIQRFADKVDLYLSVLAREMKQRRETWFARNTYPATVYVGGGTPTALSEEQLRVLLESMEEIFKIRGGIVAGCLKEYTVEAGRPDSITRGKLRLLKEFGVSRISVNPQTMNQKTLDLIGRAHTVEQTCRAFQMAREEGFHNINMDLIMGLPGENEEDVRNTLRQIKELGPDSLTVHTLAIKRSSEMGIAQRLQNGQLDIPGGALVETMIQDAYQTALSMGMNPYYLYRQKMITGNFENIGYARPGKEGLYNILIMEEIQSIIACGAGATTKIIRQDVPRPDSRGPSLKEPSEGRGQIIRQENVKNIEEYIRRGTC